MSHNIGIARRLFLTVLLVGGIITLLLTAVATYIDYRNKAAELNGTIENIKSTALRSLEDAVWTFDESQTKSIAAGITNFPDVTMVKLISESGDALYEGRTDGKTGPFRWLFGSQPQVTTLELFSPKGTGDRLGELRVEIDYAPMHGRVFERAAEFFLIQGVKTLLTTMVVLWAFRQLLTKHILAIRDYLAAIKPDLTETPSDLVLKRNPLWQDELSSVAKISSQLAQALAKVNAQNNEKLDSQRKQVALQEAKAIQAAKLASLGEMAAGIAHEINTPLSVIGLAALKVRKLTSKAPDIAEETNIACNRIEKAVANCSQITRSMLQFARQESSDAQTTDTVSLKSFLSDNLFFFHSKAPAQNIDFQLTENYPENLEVQLLRTSISQVIVNLVNNAFYAATKESSGEDAKVFVTVEWSQETLKVTIKDSGPGVPIHIVDKIFDPFFTTKPVGQGTGLGLSVSKSLIESMGGSLSYLRIEPWTVFEFQVPAPVSNKDITQHRAIA
jgi:signal transduction histidine kinase